MPVQRATTSAMSSSSTSSLTIGVSGGAASRSAELLLELGQLAVAGSPRPAGGRRAARRARPRMRSSSMRCVISATRSSASFSSAQRAASSLRQLLRLGQLPLDRLAHVRRLLRHRGELDLELADAPLGLVELERRRVDLHAQARRGLVDEVDRLVRQAAGRRCTGRRAPPPRRARRRGSRRRGAPRSAPSARAGSRSCPSTDGSPTKIGWKRRSSAASFSMCLRYSSSVVAPIARSSPRASIGFSRFAASTAPSAAPAPTIVCSSSMKRMISPGRGLDLGRARP